MDALKRFRGCLIGLAVGDAIGAPYEGMPRRYFNRIADTSPEFSGHWTDDTSMALCLALSLVEKRRFDPQDQMDRYLRWYKHGYMSSRGIAFGIGSTVLQALKRYERTGIAYSGSEEPMSAGNGCIMRLAPIALFYYPDREKIIHFAGESSRTTHGARECIEACRLLGNVLFQALSGADKDKVLSSSNPDEFSCKSIKKIAEGAFRSKTFDEIQTTGYVVETLEAALWCFFETESFKEAILQAVNLGLDTDTTASVCGQIAGAHYGIDSIPSYWMNRIAMLKEILEIADSLFYTTPLD